MRGSGVLTFGGDQIGSLVTNFMASSNSGVKLEGVNTVCGDIRTESNGYFTGTGTLVVDASAAPRTVSADLRGSVTLRKKGVETVTASGTAAIPTLDVRDGDFVVTGTDSTISNLTLAAGTRLVADGVTVSVTGSIASSGTFASRNGGAVVIRRAAGLTYSFADDQTVGDYYIDGVWHAHGDYQLGGVTLHVAGAYPFVRAGDDETLATSPTGDTKVSIAGSLTVPTGITAAQGTGTTVSFGAPSGWGTPASLVVDGGTFGLGDSKYAIKINHGEDGGRGLMTVRNGGNLGAAEYTISANAAPDPDGYINFLRLEGGTATLRQVFNNNSHTARVVVAGGQFSTAHNQEYIPIFKGGNFLFESENHAKIVFNLQNAMHRFGYYVRTIGEGDVELRQSNNNKNTELYHCRFDNAGSVIVNGSGSMGFGGSRIGPLVTNFLVTSSAAITLDNTAGGVNTVYGDIHTANNGYFTGTGTLVVDASAAPRAVSADLRGSVTLRTQGAETVTVTGTAAIPKLDVSSGTCILRGTDCTVGDLTVAAGATLTVIGCTITVTGNMNVAGTVDASSLGGVVLKAVTGGSYALPAGDFTLREYWLDGERQDDGSYSLGGATLVVRGYDESCLSVWTNESETQTEYDFTSGAAYLGLRLRTPPAALAFGGTGVQIGSAGITTVGATAETDHAFNLPLAVATSQLWNFGAASATIAGGLAHTQAASAPLALEIRSESEVALTGSNSTYLGDLTVSGNVVRVSGTNPFGSASAGGRDKVVVNLVAGGSAFCSFDGVTTDRPLTLACEGPNLQYMFRFEDGSTNLFNGYVAMPRWSKFGANSRVEFAGGVSFANYTRQWMLANSEIVIRNRFDLIGTWGARTFYPGISSTDTRIVLDAAVCFASDEVEKWPIYLYGNWIMQRDYAFTRGYLLSPANDEWGLLDLNGHPQRLTRIDGLGARQVLSTDPAALELDYKADACHTNALAFTGCAGVRKLGEGTSVLLGTSTSTGDVRVDAGTLRLGGRWRSPSSVTVAEDATLVLDTASSIGSKSALVVAKGGELVLNASVRVLSATIGGVALKSGTYPASEIGCGGTGSLSVGRSGFLIYVK